MKNTAIISWINARNGLLIRHETTDNGDVLEWWSLNSGHTVLVQSYADDNGWEIFINPSSDNRIDTTLRNADKIIVGGKQ